MVKHELVTQRSKVSAEEYHRDKVHWQVGNSDDGGVSVEYCWTVDAFLVIEYGIVGVLTEIHHCNEGGDADCDSVDGAVEAWDVHALLGELHLIEVPVAEGVQLVEQVE